MRGIRGAITAEHNSRESMGEATRRLLCAMLSENNLKVKDIISVQFTVTSDLNAVFPAAEARKMNGWNHVPMLCAVEMDVPGSMGKCIRVLMLADTQAGQSEVKHVYLEDAVALRPDLSE